MKHRRILAITIACSFLTLAVPLQGEVIQTDFSSSSGWVYYEHVDDGGYTAGDWNIWNSDGEYLELVQNGTEYGMGRAWVDHKMPSGAFDAEYKWQPTASQYNADGFTFGWVEDGMADLGQRGNVGGCMGAFKDWSHEENPAHTGYFVEVDYYENSSDYDPDRYHVGLMQSWPDRGVPNPVGETYGFASDEFHDDADAWYRMRVKADPIAQDGSRTIQVWMDRNGNGEYDTGENWLDTDDDKQYDDASMCSWTVDNYADVFGSGHPGTYSYGFTSGTGGNTGSFRIDDVTLNAVPEPASALLAAAAACAGGLAAFRRKRRS